MRPHLAKEAVELVAAFVDPAILNSRIYYLLFVTFNVQVGIGYLGIGFLREEQRRRKTVNGRLFSAFPRTLPRPHLELVVF